VAGGKVNLDGAFKLFGQNSQQFLIALGKKMKESGNFLAKLVFGVLVLL